MEGGSLLRPRFHAPTRWDASLSSQPGASGPRAAPRSRWEPARGVCGQYSQLSALSAARAVPMAGQRHEKAAPGQYSVTSIDHWKCTAPLAGLEPSGPPASLYPVGASAPCRGRGRTSQFRQPRRHVSASFSSRACTHSADLGQSGSLAMPGPTLLNG
jgi:hypothetical protein